MRPRPIRKEVNRGGAWTPEEDRKLAQAIDVHGPRHWNLVGVEAGLNRGGKSCRLRWLNYLRPNIKRGNISDQEEDLILRLHRLLGNRWSLIAGRLPGRTDNEIKNYWNTHLSRKVKQTEKVSRLHKSRLDSGEYDRTKKSAARPDEAESGSFRQEVRVDGVDNEDPPNLEWISRFMEMDDSWFDFALPA